MRTLRTNSPPCINFSRHLPQDSLSLSLTGSVTHTQSHSITNYTRRIAWELPRRVAGEEVAYQAILLDVRLEARISVETGTQLGGTGRGLSSSQPGQGVLKQTLCLTEGVETNTVSSG